MDWETAQDSINEALFQSAGRRLSSVETILLQGAWERRTYDQIADKAGYSPNYLKMDVGPALWKHLSAAFGEKVTKPQLQTVVERYQRRKQVATSIPLQPETLQKDPQAPLPSPSVKDIPLTRTIDWGDAPDVTQFYGRAEELTTLKQWIVTDRCRLVALLGMGGIGKSALATKLAQDIQTEFDVIIWRSLRNAPSLERLLGELVPYLSSQRETEPTIQNLLHCFKTVRCLLILDNMETILHAGSRAGHYRSGYQDYGELLRVLGEANHQSCLLLTSREKPEELAMFEGVALAVHSLNLSGSLTVALALITACGLVGTSEQQQKLSEHYGCSPLAMKIVASSIRDLFDGDIVQFLAEETIVFNGVRRLLDQQFDRLSELEHSIMYWLAINREWTSTTELVEDLVPKVPRSKVLEALESLSWRSLLERQLGRYTQQPVVMEYITDQLTEHIYQELVQANPFTLFHDHALLKTTVTDYVKDTQVRLILSPIAEQFRATFDSPSTLEHQLKQQLQQLQAMATPGYGGGNLINLIHYLSIDLTGYDFSGLTVWHAYLQQAQLHRVNFHNADLSKSIFTQTFGNIFSVAFSPDAQFLAAGDMDGHTCLWRLSDHQPYVAVGGHNESIWGIAWCPDCQVFATGSEDRLINLWDVHSGACLKTLEGPDAVRAIAWSPDGEMLASGGDDSQVSLWQVNTGECQTCLKGHTNWIYSVAFSPDGRWLASGSFDRTIRIWDVAQGQCHQVLRGHSGGIWSVAWHPNGLNLASASDDATIKLWDVSNGECVTTLKGHKSAVFSIAWGPDGNVLASGSLDTTIRLWNPDAGQCLTVLQGHTKIILSIAWSHKGGELASGSNDRTVRFWEPTSGQCRHILQGFINNMCSVCWSPDGKMIASSSNDQTIRIWNPSTGQCLNRLEGHSNWIWQVAWSPDGQTLASSSDDQTVRLWNPNTGKCHQILVGHQLWVWAVVWSPDGQMLASGSADQTVRLWNPNTGKCLHILEGHSNWIWNLAWSPDGQMLASSSDDQTIRLWNIRQGKCVKTIVGHSGYIRVIDWHPDGQILASGSADQTIRLWEIESGETLTVLEGHTDLLRGLAWHPRGEILASSGADHTIRLWNRTNGECLRILRGHQAIVWSVQWCPNQEILASGSADGTIKFWDMKTGDCLQTLRPDRPYEGMNITGVSGLTEAQKETLQRLGAVES